MNSLASPQKPSSLDFWFLFICLGSFFFWDFYIFSVRVFDFVGLAALTLFFAAKARGNSGIDLYRTLVVILLTAVIFVGSVRGAIASDENFKIALGILLGFGTFLILLQIPLSSHDLARAIRVILFLSSAFIVIQTIVYYGSGFVLHPLNVLGLQPRSFSAVYRPTGIFLEPAHYALSTIMLMALLYRIDFKIDLTFIFAALTIFVSLSLWGIVVIALFTLLILVRAKRIFLSASFLILFGATALALSSLLENNPLLSFILDRIGNIHSDGSAYARYGGLGNITENLLGDWAAWFGVGFTNDYHGYGANGLAFIISGIGILGTIVLSLCLGLLSSTSFLFSFFLFFGLMLTAAPLWGNFLWWGWLALYLKKF